MTGRIAGALALLVLLALVGAGAGYVSNQDEPVPPASFSPPVAVPAESPSLPVNVYDVTPDPDTPPLAVDTPLSEAKFRAGGFALRAPVPDDWLRVELSGRSSWQFSRPENPSGTYVLRLGIVAGERRAPSVAAASRVFALRQQELDGNSQNLIVEEQTDTGFTYTLIDAAGHQRVGIEEFLTVPGNDSAYFTVAVSGREVDREGMVSLLQRVTAGAYVP
ncbi:hypothetical protein [Nocardioides sp.]|uniref:hypothetical protein n=1 Tax=Nocardioides sp. TaxID=35761 RepID=UPI002B276BE2|nr:hypothetical protein [Nocardioides sp.]